MLHDHPGPGGQSIGRRGALRLIDGRACATGWAVVQWRGEFIGQRLNLPVASLSPEEANEHFGWLAGFASIDAPASSALTRKRLGWEPKPQPGLIEDVANLRYGEG